MTRVRVFNQMGERIGARLAGAFPDGEVEVVAAPAGEPPPAGAEAEVLFGGWGPPDVQRQWLERGVRWVQLAGTGVDRLTGERFGDRVVTCARGASAVPISEFVLAAMLAFEKQLPGVWLREPPEHWNAARLGTLDGRTLALVGLGGIGSAIAARALPFGMRVRALRRTGAPSPVPGVEVIASFADLLPDADHLVLAAPATPRTRHLVDAAALAQVKPGLHLVNIARGALVDQDALRAALDDGRVACASLDTVDPEPLPAGHWLYTHPGVRLSAHVSWSSPRGLDAAVDVFVANLRRFVAGEPLEHVVDWDEGY